MSGGGSGFSLSGADNSFSSKSADIFGGLAALEKKHETVQQAQAKEDKGKVYFKDDPVLDSFGASRKRGEKTDRDRSRDRGSRDDNRQRGERDVVGRERQERDRDGFRIPQGRPPTAMTTNSSNGGGGRRNNRGGGGGRRVPEHKKNPQNFTHYNLSDTPEMSERANSAAAFDFLKSQRKGGGEDDDGMDFEEEGGGGSRMVFKKPSAKGKAAGNEEEKKSTSGSGKLVMPEYVVGQKPVVKKSSKTVTDNVFSSKSNEGSSIKIDLGHLNEDEGEPDSEGGASSGPVTFKKVSRKGQRRKKEEEEEEEEIKQAGKGGVKRKPEEEVEAEEEEASVVRIDRAAERRNKNIKKSRVKLYQRQQLADSGSDDEEGWEEELKKAREEEEKEEEVEDMICEGV